VVSVLEIGTFEGVASLYLARFANIKKIVTVDPFPEYDASSVGVNSMTRSNFTRNLTKSAHSVKIQQIRQTSDVFFAENRRKFDLIYVDGSHDPAQAVRDLDNAGACLEDLGILWIDDYGSNYSVNGLSLNTAIRGWVAEKKDEYSVIHQGYQMGLLKL
jgi:predicted O-methyltransferase YrrM